MVRLLISLFVIAASHPAARTSQARRPSLEHLLPRHTTRLLWSLGRLARWVRTETNLAMCTIAERLVVRLPTAAQGHTCVFADHVAAGTFNADVATDVERAVGPDIDGCCLQLPFLRPAVEASKWSATLGQVMIVSAI